MLEREVRTLHVVKPDPPSQSQSLNRSIGDGATKPGVLQQLRAREGLAALQADDVPFHRFRGQERTLPPAPMSRSPGQTLMVCGAFVGTAPRASYSTSKASGGASLRFSRSLIWSRFAWDMTRLTSGCPRLGDEVINYLFIFYFRAGLGLEIWSFLSCLCPIPGRAN